MLVLNWSRSQYIWFLVQMISLKHTQRMVLIIHTRQALYRDRGSWYNFVIAYDTTQSTASDRIKVYVNGSQDTTLGGSSFPAENQ